MTVCHVIVKIYGLTGVFLHEPTVYERSVLDRDEETWPADPGEGHGLLAARQRRDEATRRHLKVVLAILVLGDCDGQPVGDDDEVLLVVACPVHGR